MIIISHRGMWKARAERNTPEAFKRSFDAGFGTETDLRDCAGQIVISHDMPRGGEPSFEGLLKLMNGRNLPLALNIKADGLADAVRDLLDKYQHTNYFTFDMSIPDQVVQLDKGMRVFTGISDIMREPVMGDESAGVWLDSYNYDWFEPDLIDSLIEMGKQVCVVSPELHGRDRSVQWERLLRCKYIHEESLMLCTDTPEDAKGYF
jgi:glycerophosphoryl diester phosphodiesterase